jgi:hypothetical protein
VEKAALGGCDLSVAYIGDEWQWLVKCQGREVARGCRARLTGGAAAGRIRRPVFPRLCLAPLRRDLGVLHNTRYRTFVLLHLQQLTGAIG